jgi:hypothetical protein
MIHLQILRLLSYVFVPPSLSVRFRLYLATFQGVRRPSFLCGCCLGIFRATSERLLSHPESFPEGVYFELIRLEDDYALARDGVFVCVSEVIQEFVDASIQLGRTLKAVLLRADSILLGLD